VSRLPRSLIFYVAASSIYAAIVYILVHATYGLELGRSGLRLPAPESIVTSIDLVSFIIWIGLSLIAGTVLYRLATALSLARGEGRQRDGEIASIFALGQALSGSLELEAIAGRYLESARGALDPSVTAALYIQDDAAGAFVRLLERGPAAGKLGHAKYTASDLPAPVRTRVLDHQSALVITDALANPAWAPLSAGLPDPAWIRSFAALPLVSHDRLVGLAFFGAPGTGVVNADGLQLASLVTQFVASAVRTSLTFSEAQRRANREAIVNRVAQRARASLDPDEVLRTTIEDLGRALHVSRAIATLGSSAEDLRITQEWTAPGVTPLGIGTTAVNTTRLAVQLGRTAQVHDDMSRIATPIVIGGKLAGAIALHAEPSREWSVDDERLIEGIAREVRSAMESARLFQARERENERLLALQRASATVATRSTTREVIDDVLRIASQLLSEASASLYLWDRKFEVLRLAQNADRAGREVSSVLGKGEGMSGELLARLDPLVVNDYPSWSGASQIGIETGLRAVLAVPLVRSGELLGAIVLRSYDANTSFTLDDARLLGLFGDQAVAALANAEAFERQRVAMEELEKVNRAKSEFVSIVSHEFRTPLTGIQGFSEMMRDEDLTPEEVKEYASDINTDAQRLNRMITEMLDLDKMEAGRMTLHLEPTDLNAIVRDAAERLRPNAPSHPITLTLAPDLPQLQGDRDRLTQVVSNLLSNAMKYSPTGGEIVVSTASDDGTVRLSVIDHGIGIPADKLETIWERYARIESSTTRGIQGTGLGLPIVRQIVTMHGGRVWAESEIGRGSVFHVVLPLAAGSQAVQA
jgi:signal transduction histidine kinase